MRRNPLIKQIVAEFISTRSKYTWFVGSPLAVLMPLTAVAKAIYIYCNFMAFYIYLMTNNNIEICRGANRVKLKGLLGPLIRETCLLQPGPLTPYVYEVEWNGFNFFPDIGRVEYGVWILATVPVVKYSRGLRGGDGAKLSSTILTRAKKFQTL